MRVTVGGRRDGRLSLQLVWILVAAVGLQAGCHRRIHSTLSEPISPAQLAELWVEPEPDRDLFHGVGGSRLAPDAGAPFTVIEIKRSGYSSGYTLSDARGQEWSAKFPPEAAAEVTASRLHWGVGFHQPPIYYVGEWRAAKATSPNPQMPARFRQKSPDLHGLDAQAVWSFYRNPFVGTRQLAGLLVLQAMLGNSDLKDDNNALYSLSSAHEGAAKWYVTRDLGHTFGRTGIIDAPRNDIRVFEETPFVTGIVDGKIVLDYRGRHKDLFRNITAEDVRWICTRLQKLTDRQWDDAFRAGGYDKELADRFIQRMKQKVAEGLSLKG